MDEIYKISVENFSTEFIFYVLLLKILLKIKTSIFLKCKGGSKEYKANHGYEVKKSCAKREYHDENVFFKADIDSSKYNFLFHLKSKTNLLF